MRAILIGLGSAGDVHPVAGLALAMRERGHEVLLAAPSPFEDLARRLDLPFEGIGTREWFDRALADPDLWRPLKSFPAVARHLFLPAIRPVYDIIARHSRGATTVAAAPVTAFGARIAQEKLGVALATLHLQPVLIRSVRQPPCFGFPDILGRLPGVLRGVYLRAADRLVIDPVLAPAVNSFRQELGLPPVRRLLDRWAHSPGLVVGLFPEWFAPPQPDWLPNVHLTGFPLYDESDWRRASPELEKFLAAGDAPVVFTAGSANAQAGKFFREAVEICRGSGRRGLLLTRFEEQLPALEPGRIEAFDYVPFSAVFPLAAAIVHHGGIGTTAQGMAAGTPQLVVPRAHDQPDNALRIRRLGVGDFVLPRAFTRGRAVSRLTALMSSPDVAGRCRRLAAELDGKKALARTCDLLEGLAARGRA